MVFHRVCWGCNYLITRGAPCCRAIDDLCGNYHSQLGIDDLWGFLVGLSTGPFLEPWKKGRVTRMGAQDFENHIWAKTMLGLGSRNFESCNHVTIDTKNYHKRDALF